MAVQGIEETVTCIQPECMNQFTVVWLPKRSAVLTCPECMNRLAEAFWAIWEEENR